MSDQKDIWIVIGEETHPDREIEGYYGPFFDEPSAREWARKEESSPFNQLPSGSIRYRYYVRELEGPCNKL